MKGALRKPSLRSSDEAFRLALQHRGLAIWVVRRYFRGVSDSVRDDLDQEAFLALVRVCELYDPAAGNLTTLAVPSVRWVLFRKVSFFKCVGHIPDAIQQRFRRLRRQYRWRPPSHLQSALENQGDRRKETWRADAYHTFFLGERSLSEEARTGDSPGDHATLLDELADSEATDPEDAAGARRRERLVHELLAATELTSREREVIEKRFLSDEGETLETLGAKMGVSRERIRQLESLALRKLRLKLERRVAEGDL